MKKFTKICLVLSLVLVLIGGTICVMGAATGGWRLVRGMERNDAWWNLADMFGYAYHWDRNWDNWGENIDDSIENSIENSMEHVEEAMDNVDRTIENTVDRTMGDNYYGDYDYDDDYDYDSESQKDFERGSMDMDDYFSGEYWSDFGNADKTYTVDLNYTDMQIAASQVQRIYIDIGVKGGAALYIKPSENGSFGIEKSGKGDYNCYLYGNDLYLYGDGRSRFKSGNNNENVYLYIPSSLDLSELVIKVGGGLVQTDKLEADRMKLEAGAGLISVNEINSSQLFTEVGAGEIRLKKVNTDAIDVEVGVGYAQIEGSIKKKIDAECALGSIRMKLAGKQEDYDYNISGDAGTVRLGSLSYTALTNEKYLNNGADAKASFECSLGSIDVSFNN